MPSHASQEIACLFSTDEQSGNRKPVEVLTPKSIIGFMDATPWCGETRDRRRTNAMERIDNFVNAVYGDEKPNDLHICSYASPECIDVEDRWIRISKGQSLSDYQKQFAEKYLVPLVSPASTGGGGSLT
jgi:hypothetical protein